MPQAATKRQQQAVEQTRYPGPCLVLRQVEQRSDQREARHQEQHRRDEADRVGEGEAVHAEADHDQAVEAGRQHGAQGGHRELVEAPAREQGAGGLADAAADRRSPGRQQVAAVEVGEGRRGDRHRQRDGEQPVQRGRLLDAVEFGSQGRRVEAGSGAERERFQGGDPRRIDAGRTDLARQRNGLAAAPCRRAEADGRQLDLKPLDAERSAEATHGIAHPECRVAGAQHQRAEPQQDVEGLGERCPRPGHQTVWRPSTWAVSLRTRSTSAASVFRSCP